MTLNYHAGKGTMLGSRTIDVPGHELVRQFSEPTTGLSCIIALHSTKLGPAMGGCRLWDYENAELAIADAVRLSRGMSFKNASAGLPLGGGKAVIIKPKKIDRAAFMRAFGDAVESLKGSYVTAEDVGTSVQDMKYVAEKTPFVSGITNGDPSPWTAKGVYFAMREAVEIHLKKESLRGLTVAVQGMGNVGRYLCELLHQDGAKLVVADLKKAALQDVEARFGAAIVGAESIHKVDCDVYSPCALGAGLNAGSIPEVRAKVICGGANNQLGTDADGERLRAAGIAYVPDYVANAGGIINVAAEYYGWSAIEIDRRLREIPGRVAELIQESMERGLATNFIADEVAMRKIAQPEKTLALNSN